MAPKKRVKCWRGVEPGQVRQIVREWLSKHKWSNAEMAFVDMMDLDFKMAARLAPMIKFADLIEKLISVVKNGKVAHVCCKKALFELISLEPKLLRTSRKKNFVLGVSSGIRAIMTWYREYGKGGSTKEKLTKAATPTQRALLEQVIGNMILDPPGDGDDEDEEEEEEEEDDRDEQAGGHQEQDENLEVDHNPYAL